MMGEIHTTCTSQIRQYTLFSGVKPREKVSDHGEVTRLIVHTVMIADGQSTELLSLDKDASTKFPIRNRVDPYQAELKLLGLLTKDALPNRRQLSRKYK